MGQTISTPTGDQQVFGIGFTNEDLGRGYFGDYNYAEVCSSFNALLERIRNNDSTLQSINFHDIFRTYSDALGLTDTSTVYRKHVVQFISALSGNNVITEINLNQCRIRNTEATALAKIIATNSALKKLDLSNNLIEDDGITALAKALTTNHALEHLDLSYNRSSRSNRNNGIANLVKALTNNHTLQNLNLSTTWLTDSEAIILATGISTNFALTHLNLSRNGIENEGAIAIAKSLKSNSKLTHLDMSENLYSEKDVGITDDGAVAFAYALETNSTLTNLNLSENRIGYEGSIIIAKALKKNSTLTHLGFSISINDAAAIALADAMKINSTLTHLTLSFDKVKDDGILALLQTRASLEIHADSNAYIKDRLSKAGFSMAVDLYTNASNILQSGKKLSPKDIVIIWHAVRMIGRIDTFFVTCSSIMRGDAESISQIIKSETFTEMKRIAEDMPNIRRNLIKDALLDAQATDDINPILFEYPQEQLDCLDEAKTQNLFFSLYPAPSVDFNINIGYSINFDSESKSISPVDSGSEISSRARKRRHL